MQDSMDDTYDSKLHDWQTGRWHYNHTRTRRLMIYHVTCHSRHLIQRLLGKRTASRQPTFSR